MDGYVALGAYDGMNPVPIHAQQHASLDLRIVRERHVHGHVRRIHVKGGEQLVAIGSCRIPAKKAIEESVL